MAYGFDQSCEDCANCVEMRSMVDEVIGYVCTLFLDRKLTGGEKLVVYKLDRDPRNNLCEMWTSKDDLPK